MIGSGGGGIEIREWRGVPEITRVTCSWGRISKVSGGGGLSWKRDVKGELSRHNKLRMGCRGVRVSRVSHAAVMVVVSHAVVMVVVSQVVVMLLS